jgi:hypothetical protein
MAHRVEIRSPLVDEFRSPLTVVVASVVLVASGLLLIAAWDRVDGWVIVGMVVPFALVGGPLIYTQSKLVVVADETGLYVRNQRGKRRFDWSEVEGFRRGVDRRTLVGYVLLQGGEVLPLDATKTWPTKGNVGRLDAQLRRLRSCRPHLGGAPSGPQS